MQPQISIGKLFLTTLETSFILYIVVRLGIFG